MKRYEYARRHPTTPYQRDDETWVYPELEILKQMGDDGWILAAVSHKQNKVFYFYREIFNESKD